MGKYRNNILKDEEILCRDKIPSDLHWIPPNMMFLGEVYDTVNDKYYSQRAGKKYRPPVVNPHLDEGHYQGYRFAIQKLTKEGDMILDPTVGSGTAVIEAINNGRNAIGVELEWPDLCSKNCEYQNSENWYSIFPGNVFNIQDMVDRVKFKEGVSLIINGTPYPILHGNKTSDAPFGTSLEGYMDKKSYGNLKYPKGDYEFFIRDMYKKTDFYLKKGGYFCLIIKDPIQNKKPFLLQKKILSWVQEDLGYEKYGYFIHRHIPETLFMRTYRKRFPDVLIPSYQIGCILKK